MTKLHTLPIRVYYEDTDAAGIVYHASYLRFAERGRTEMLRDAGFEHAEILKNQGVAFTVISMQINFRSPAKLDELLNVKTVMKAVKGASMEMEQSIYRGDTLLVDMALKIACIDKNGKAARLPEAVRELFKNT
ncbi:MAG: tol-pal system-associated acyl-CoA thioesterase [Alphaproteobacteria bacterium]|nr:MAG: tol-pal system-associated acyl-CoA thioesterase [Alphaproteobacteria bacterium]